MPSILLVRHGQASYGADDYDVLSETGWRQAEVLAAEHARRGLTFDVVVSGGLRRQQGTAEVLARAARHAGGDRSRLGRVRRRRHPHPPRPDAMSGSTPSRARRGRPSARGTSRQLLDGALIDWIEAGTVGGAREPWPAFDARVRGALERLLAAAGQRRDGAWCAAPAGRSAGSAPR